MDNRQTWISLGILLAAMIVGLVIVFFFNNLFTMALFLVIMFCAFMYVNIQQGKDNLYHCMKCGKERRVGLLVDMLARSLDNGDKIFRCRNCKHKVNFRKGPMESKEPSSEPIDKIE